MAIKSIERGVLEESERGEPRHVVVDEVQDLVGVRRDLVETLLDRFRDVGFTVVGDVAQSIYGFQITDPQERAGETGRFFDWIRSSFLDELVERTLDENFRACTPEARVALGAGPRLQRMREDEEAAELLRELTNSLAQVPSFGSLEDGFVRASLREYDGTTGILCQDNAQVLELSRELDKHLIPHGVRRGARDRAAPPWLSVFFQVLPDGKMTESQFTEVVAGFDPSVGPPPAGAWRSLRRVAGAPGNRLDLSALRTRIAEERLPDDLTAPPGHRLTVSTIHRAKGLEFDRVLVVRSVGVKGAQQDEDVQAAVRLLYVAMTRPRLDLYRLDAPDTWMYRKAKYLPSGAERWYISYRKPQRTGMEMLEFDVAQLRPARSEESDPTAVQWYLRTKVRQGDLLNFRKLHDLPMAADETPEYGVFHNGFRIGDASQFFRRDLRRLLGGKERVTWPISIDGVRVDAVQTVVGAVGVGVQAGLPDGDVWLTPRVGGVGRLLWRGGEENTEGSVER